MVAEERFLGKLNPPLPVSTHAYQIPPLPTYQRHPLLSFTTYDLCIPQHRLSQILPLPPLHLPQSHSTLNVSIKIVASSLTLLHSRWSWIIDLNLNGWFRAACQTVLTT